MNSLIYDDKTACTPNLLGQPFKCQKCGGDKFTLRYINNPYGHDCGEEIATCTGCHAMYGGRHTRFEDPAGNTQFAEKVKTTPAQRNK